MKTQSTSGQYLRRLFVIACLVGAPALVSAQGMPREAHDNIRTLFDQHAAIKRTVTLTESGYIAVTESEDPKVARVLRAHVRQMRERLESGLAVRRWDPAYAELVEHYQDLELDVERTPKGLRIIMTGKTPAAVKIAHNHAQIVSKFVEKGWSEHDVSHPAVSTPPADDASPKSCCREAGAKGAGCGTGGCSPKAQ